MRLGQLARAVRPTLGLAGVCLIAVAASQSQPGTNSQPTLEQSYEDGNALAELANLGLTAEQLGSIEPCCQAYRQSMQELKTKRKAALNKVQPELEQRLQLLLAGKPCPDDVLAAVEATSAALEELALQGADARAELGRKVGQVLNEAQVQSLTGTNPAAAAVEALAGVRAMSAADFEQEGQMMAELLVESAAGEPPLSPEEALEVLREVRSLTAEQYREQRDAFVRHLLPLFTPSDEDVREAIADRFAYPRMADLLAQRLASMEPANP